MEVILRSYREVWREMLSSAARPDQVTRLPRRRIGAKDGVYVITGRRHDEAAAYMAQRLETVSSLADMIRLADEVELAYEVVVNVEYCS